MTDELKRLMAEKKELERKIKALTSGAIDHGDAKLDRIGFAGEYQRGHWALFYEYKFTRSRGREGRPEPASRWTPLAHGETMEEVLEKIPDVIKALTDLYEEVKHGTDS